MIPAREALRTTFDAVVDEIDNARGSQQLTNAFYAKIGNAIFDASTVLLSTLRPLGDASSPLSASTLSLPQWAQERPPSPSPSSLRSFG